MLFRSALGLLKTLFGLAVTVTAVEWSFRLAKNLTVRQQTGKTNTMRTQPKVTFSPS